MRLLMYRVVGEIALKSLKVPLTKFPGGQQLVKFEEFTPDGQKFPIKTYTVRVTVDHVPFLAEVNYGSYQGQVWDPKKVWVQVVPDETDPTVKTHLQEYTAKAVARGFHPAKTGGFCPSCDKCDKKPTTDKFEKALLLPNYAEVDVSATISLATRSAGDSIPVHEELILIPYETYDLCLLHGSHIRYGEEPID